MKGWVMFILVSLFLIGFVAAEGITGDTTNSPCGAKGGSCIAVEENCKYGFYENSSFLCNTNDEICCLKIRVSSLSSVSVGSDDNEDEEDNSAITATNTKDAETLRAKLTNAEIKKILMTRNRIKFTEKYGECPVECTCTGSTIKCTLASGREMTIIAGKSGNVIVQVKGQNMTTNVTLYRSTDGKIYGIFKNNETRRVRMLPDQVKERIKERIKAMLQNENITLDENGTYQYQAHKRVRLFFIFPVRMMVRAEIDAETGEVIKISKPKWWAFLAKDVEEPVLGASCGTVTPKENDACCQNKGFDVWNSETQQCEFNE